MRLLPLAAVALLALTACKGTDPEVEDCTNGADDDGDGDSDCADSECVTDDACTTESDCGDGEDNDADGDTDCDDDDCAADAACVSTDEDCGDAEDNDGDGATDCEDTDCTGADECRWYVWEETGAATVVPGTSYTGKSEWTFTGYYTGTDLCTMELDVTSTSPRTDCVGCEFAFDVDFANGSELSGDCAALGLDTTGATVYTYGYGYDAEYDYNGSPVPTLMYYSTYYYEWLGNYGYATATFDGTSFEYEWLVGYDYY
jgi:hypothetical protein